MSTQCYAMVRGSAIRVTALGNRGEVPDETSYAVSKSVATVKINEVVESSRDEMLDTPEEEKRIRFTRPAQTIRHKVDVEFLRVDPGLFSLISGVGLIYRGGNDGSADTWPLDDYEGGGGFGMEPFGYRPFGGNERDAIVGFDAGTRLPVKGFALEVWSKLDAAAARMPVPGFGEGPFGGASFGSQSSCDQRRWGYTLFPHLRGGYLSGFTFRNGLVSFNLLGAQTRKSSGWGVGPYDLEGRFERLVQPVSRNVSWRNLITPTAPPAEVNGILPLSADVVDNGTAADPMPIPDAPLVVDGGGAETSAYIIDGGRA